MLIKFKVNYLNHFSKLFYLFIIQIIIVIPLKGWNRTSFLLQ